MIAVIKIYLDACCLNRPFDDQTQARIRLESEAVMVILRKCQEHEFEMISSQALEYEIGKTPDLDRQARVASLLAMASAVAQITDDTISRAESFQHLGLDGIDALHLALAEMSGAEVFLTTDDRLLKRCSENSRTIGIRVANPVSWITEVY